MSPDTVIDTLTRMGVRPTQLCVDSRRVTPGDVFIAAPGAHTDGRRFLDDAVRRGAAAVLYEADGAAVPALTIPAVAVPDLAAQIGEIAHRVYGRPSESLWVAGVTGTNGKTSVTRWIAQGLEGAGRHCALVGTLGNGFVDDLEDSPNTTPEAVTLHAALARFRRGGAQACAMEVSSIGLDQERVAGVRFNVAVFTNLTRDHLEYHGTLAAYGAAKARLFDVPGLDAAVLNLDDPFGEALAQRLNGKVPTIGYSLTGRRGTDQCLQPVDLTLGGNGLRFVLDGHRFEVPLLGRFNAANLLAVIGALSAAGLAMEQLATLCRTLTPPPGRMQFVGGHAQPLVVVDYAHTPDALEQALTTLRETALARQGRLVCVFGCGGDRDPGKRPLMGAVAERLADCVVLTSDNPRSESPEAILDAIRGGMARDPQRETDRGAAIRHTIADAEVNDVILLAGKGHEPYQEIAGIRYPFSDLTHARQALEARS